MNIVALTDEAGHIGLHHHILLGHSLTLDTAIQHLLRIGNTHKAPCRQTLGEGKRHHHLTLFVSRQRGIAECCLV